VPFKFNSKGRHHIPRQRHRVTNWRDYDAALRNRGSLTELCGIFGDGVNQAADFFSDATSIPSRNVTPLTTFGN
jgi:hypothetical protein